MGDPLREKTSHKAVGVFFSLFSLKTDVQEKHVYSFSQMLISPRKYYGFKMENKTTMPLPWEHHILEGHGKGRQRTNWQKRQEDKSEMESGDRRRPSRKGDI